MSTTHSQDGTRTGSKWWALGLAALGFGVLALIFRLGALHGPAHFDEYYHLLGARGWLETGRPTILDGEYVRTNLFTGVIAQVFQLTGSDTLATGRLVSVAGGALLAPVVFLWVQTWAGWSAALIAAALTVLWPEAIDEAQRLRFYSWHTLFTFIGAVATFQAFESGAGGWRGRVGWGLIAGLSFLGALYLQVTTAFAVAAILIWVGLVHLLPLILAQPRRWLLLGLLVAACLLSLALAWAAGVLDVLWQQYRWVPGWAERSSDNPGYYHGMLRADYPVFWPLLPFAALLALRASPRLALYCILVFVIGFVALSFGGMKAYRYLSYAMPFFFILVALAIIELAGLLRGSITAALRPYDPTQRGWLGNSAVLTAALFFLAANPFFDNAIAALRGQLDQHNSPQDWRMLPELLGDWAGAPYVITTRELPTIAYLGNYDVLFNHSRMTEMDPPVAFAIDPRTGRPVIDDPASAATLLACHPEGLLLTETGQWENQDLKEELLPALEASGRMIESREGHGLLVLHWSGGSADISACTRLPQQRGTGS